MYTEKIQILNFQVGGSKHSKKLHSLYKASPILTLKDDPRIIDYIASKINMKVQTAPEARSIVQQLKYQIGHKNAKVVAEKLGYRYKENV